MKMLYNDLEFSTFMYKSYGFRLIVVIKRYHNTIKHGLVKKNHCGLLRYV